MGVLKLASANVKRLDLGDGDYLDVKADISKKSYNDLLSTFPEDYDSDKGFTPAQALGFGSSLFEMLVTGWSLEGTDPTVENYLALERNGSNVVDEKLAEHFNSLLASPTETKSSTRPSK